jgi:hypothetical protein
MRKSKTGKRTVIEPRKGDKRYVRRDKKGQFKNEVKVGRSLLADRKRKAKKTVPKGQGDRGDTGRSRSRSGNVITRLVKKLTR